MSEALLKLERVCVRFDRVRAVDDVSFSLHVGELLGLIGPNGAGKTTTLRAAAGLQPLDAGSIKVFGQDVFTHSTTVGHHLGFTPDTPALYDTLTVEQFLRFIAGSYGLKRAQASERIDHWLEMLWLADKKDEKVGALSRGMKQRLAVARTLLPDPHVILLDEPAAGLDPAGRVQFRKLLASLRDQGKAIIVSSHILADLTEYCTHIAIMGHGRLHSYGTVAEVAGAADSTRVRYRVLLAQRLADLGTRLQALPNSVSSLDFDGDTIEFEFERDRVEAAELLGVLVEAGLPVAEFRMLSPDLEQAYLRTGIGQVD